MPDVGGIFIGGRGRRMGGVPKGLLLTPSGETMVARWRRLFGELGIAAVLVGSHEAYADVDLENIEDDPPGAGPLGGLVALLTRAGKGRAVAVACDMPFVTLDLLGKLLVAESPAPVVAPYHDGLWEPLFARYDAARVIARARQRASSGEHSLQGLLDELGAAPLPLVDDELRELRDWDRPEDRFT
jgi:molybdopterin-guanine dinucleotide biosynthesis protein A